VVRVAVIGGTKFMGPFVARELADQGHQVVVYHRGKPKPLSRKTFATFTARRRGFRLQILLPSYWPGPTMLLYT
jgi:nucleoside-diphosphate-sugar epimerase